MYDVFLSHNGLQKPWVRNLYNFLVNRGLGVFFDEQSIPPGFNMLTAIEQALQESRHVVLILTPSSLASKWVAMETQLTVHEDPDSKKGKLVPILLEKVDFDTIRPSVRALNCIDLVPDGTREERLRFVLRHIGVRDVDCVTREELKPLLLDGPRIVEPAPLLVGGLDDVLDWGWEASSFSMSLFDLITKPWTISFPLTRVTPNSGRPFSATIPTHGGCSSPPRGE